MTAKEKLNPLVESLNYELPPDEDIFSDEDLEYFENNIFKSTNPSDCDWIEEWKENKVSKRKNSKRIKKKSQKIDEKKKAIPNVDIPIEFILRKPIEFYTKKAPNPYNVENSDRNYCALCKQSFVKPKSYDLHNLKYHFDHYQCSYCPHKRRFKINNIDEFKTHIYQHYQEAKVCIQCGKDFPRVCHYNQHLKEKGKYHDNQCAQCPETFETFNDHKDHVKQCHPEGWMLKCGLCKDIFKKINELRTHIAKVHKGTYKEPILKEKPFCDICGLTVDSLQKHYNEKHSKIEESHPCSHCSVICSNKTALKKHMDRNHLKYPCSLCGEMVSKSRKSRHEALKHMKERKFKCNMCEKSFITNSTLNDHMNVHNGEKPYKCQYCDICFANRSNRYMHQRIHLGYKRKKKSRLLS